jgi:hypothetical protein
MAQASANPFRNGHGARTQRGRLLFLKPEPSAAEERLA